MRKLWLGIDVGGTSTRFLFLDDEGEWSGFHKIATHSWAGQPEPLSSLADIVKTMSAGKTVSGIMLGLPGILSQDRQQVVSLPFIQALDNTPAAANLSRLVNIPVAMDKDVNHLMLWDMMQLAEMPKIAVGLYLGTGMGNSIWIGGGFYHGANGGSGEIGHAPWADNTEPCPCGNVGCVETLTSGHWLTQWARINAPDTPIGELFSAHRAHPELAAFVSRLAKSIAGEMNILDPQYLFLGGGVLSMADFPIEELHGQIRRYLRPPLTKNNLTIVVSHSTDLTGCRGACLAARRCFGERA